jgi:hypothetical protein
MRDRRTREMTKSGSLRSTIFPTLASRELEHDANVGALDVERRLAVDLTST